MLRVTRKWAGIWSRAARSARELRLHRAVVSRTRRERAVEACSEHCIFATCFRSGRAVGPSTDPSDRCFRGSREQVHRPSSSCQDLLKVGGGAAALIDRRWRLIVGDGALRLARERVAQYAYDMGGYEAVEQEMQLFAADVRGDAVNALVNALQPLDEAKIRVLRSAVHELRTPLTTVVGFIELLADYGPMTDAQHRVLRAITRSVQRLEDLVDTLEPTDPGHVRESTAP